MHNNIQNLPAYEEHAQITLTTHTVEQTELTNLGQKAEMKTFLLKYVESNSGQDICTHKQ